MMKKRFSEEQIICILKEAEAIGNVREVCRQHNIAEQTLFRWRRKFGGMELSEAKRLRELERENLQLTWWLSSRLIIACCATLSQKSGKPGCQVPRRGILAGGLQRE
jgi:putative transposase